MPVPGAWIDRITATVEGPAPDSGRKFLERGRSETECELPSRSKISTGVADVDVAGRE